MAVRWLIGHVGDLAILDLDDLVQLLVHDFQLMRQLLIVVLLGDVLSSFLEEPVFQP